MPVDSAVGCQGRFSLGVCLTCKTREVVFPSATHSRAGRDLTPIPSPLGALQAVCAYVIAAQAACEVLAERGSIWELLFHIQK